jgi:hypothetical protein
MRDFQSHSDRETLALAISLEEVDEPSYADFAEGASCTDRDFLAPALSRRIAGSNPQVRLLGHLHAALARPLR